MPETTIREFIEPSADLAVRGFIHLPAGPNGNGLILTHGAGASAQAPLLRALADAFGAAGVTVLRCDLPFRQSRPFGPPGPGDAARDRAGIKNAAAAIKKILGAPPAAVVAKSEDFPPTSDRGKIYLGGHSYGGRQASMLCAEEPDLASALLLCSYPLHPPRKPEQQRTQHLPDLHTPTLFVHGTRDPFGSIEELERAIKMIPARTTLLPIEGAGHDLGFKGKTSRQEEISRRVFSEFTKFCEVSS